MDRDGTQLTVTLTGADFVITQGRGNRFDGFIDGPDVVTFVIGDASAYYYFYEVVQHDLIERLSTNSAFIVSGIVTARPTSSGIAGTLNGVFSFAQGSAPPFRRFSSNCRSNTHRFEMVRR